MHQYVFSSKHHDWPDKARLIPGTAKAKKLYKLNGHTAKYTECQTLLYSLLQSKLPFLVLFFTQTAPLIDQWSLKSPSGNLWKSAKNLFAIFSYGLMFGESGVGSTTVH